MLAPLGLEAELCDRGEDPSARLLFEERQVGFCQQVAAHLDQERLETLFIVSQVPVLPMA